MILLELLNFFFFFEIKPHKLQAISRIQQRRAELWHLEPGWGGGVKLWAPIQAPNTFPKATSGMYRATQNILKTKRRKGGPNVPHRRRYTFQSGMGSSHGDPCLGVCLYVCLFIYL